MSDVISNVVQLLERETSDQEDILASKRAAEILAEVGCYHKTTIAVAMLADLTFSRTTWKAKIESSQIKRTYAEIVRLRNNYIEMMKEGEEILNILKYSIPFLSGSSRCALLAWYLSSSRTMLTKAVSQDDRKEVREYIERINVPQTIIHKIELVLINLLCT